MNELLGAILKGFVEIFKSPAKDWSVIWLLAPIFLFWIILEIYFDKHKKEALGWNTALGNGLSLFWVTISCLKFVFAAIFSSKDITSTFGAEIFWRMFWIFVIFIYSLFIIWVSFKHNIKDKYFYPLASPTPIYYLSAVIVVLAYGVLSFSWIIIFDLFILYWIILGLELLIKHFIPEDEINKENDTLSGGSSIDSFGSPAYGSTSSDPFASSGSTSTNNDSFGSTEPSNQFSGSPNNYSNSNSDDPFKF